MHNYKLSVSKNGKKYTIVFKAETEKLAREKVHNEGYSILSIEQIFTKDKIGNTFIFKAKIKNGTFKKGKIVGNDLFKAYIKLKKDLEYDIIELYPEVDANKLTENQKAIIVNDLKEEYELVFKKEKIKKVKIEDVSELPIENKLDNFYLKKELIETYKLIDFVLIKFEKLLSGEAGIDLLIEEKEKLKTIFNSIIKIKKTTNITKLKSIGEAALLKIGKIELREVENKQKDSTIALLKDTNSLLKQIGSKESFIEKNKDIKYILSKTIESIKISFNKLIKKKKQEEIDKHAHSYVKNMLFLKRYKQKLKENDIFIIKNIFKLLINKELRIDTFIERVVIKQNITLLIAKEKGISYSYTFVKKGVKRLIKSLNKFILDIREYLFIIIFIYTILFIVLLNINYYFNIYDFNYEGIFFFIVLFLLFLIFYIIKKYLIIIYLGITLFSLFFIYFYYLDDTFLGENIIITNLSKIIFIIILYTFFYLGRNYIYLFSYIVFLFFMIIFGLVNF